MISAKNNQKGFVHFVLVAFLLVVILALVGYILYSQNNLPFLNSDEKRSVDYTNTIDVSQSDKTVVIEQELIDTNLDLEGMDGELEDLENEASSL